MEHDIGAGAGRPPSDGDGTRPPTAADGFGTPPVAYKVGQRWPGGEPLAEGFGWYPSVGQFLVCWPGLRDEEIDAWRSGRIGVAVCVDGPLLLVCLRPAGLAWQAAIWAHAVTLSRGLTPDDANTLRERVRQLRADPAGRWLQTVVLVDADTQTIAAIRAFTLSPHLSAMLLREVAERLDGPPLDDPGMVALVAAHRQRHPDLDRLVARNAVASGFAGS